ncbi:MAG: hypothetical protein AB2L24_06815 [Mangrovibacterium sp.]
MKINLINIPAIILLVTLYMPFMYSGYANGTFPVPDDPLQKGTIHVVGHAHMDMNWLWTYSETMKMCHDNLHQTVAFMDEFPDFTMLQNQAVVYHFVEKVDPPLFELVKKYVKEGRLELAGSMWTEREDFNVPVYAAEPPSLALAKKHATHPEENSFISVDQKTIILSGLKQAEEGKELIVRIAEVEGKETT